MGAGSAEPVSALQCIDEQIMCATGASALSRRAKVLTRCANGKMAYDPAQVSRFTGRKIGERVLSEATGVNPVRSSDARSAP